MRFEQVLNVGIYKGYVLKIIFFSRQGGKGDGITKYIYKSVQQKCVCKFFFEVPTQFLFFGKSLKKQLIKQIWP